jgi:DNA-binding response OmpR family regulator
MSLSSLTLRAMSASESAGEAGGASAALDATGSSAASLRIAVLDRDSGFIQVLSKRLDRLAWEHRVLASPVPADAVVSMRLSALVVDLAVLGPQAWGWLVRLCEALPELGIVVCTGPSTVAQRVRGLRLGADDWITKPCHPEEVIARVQSVVRRRRRSTSRAETEPITAGEVEIRSDRFQAFVGKRSIDLTRREFELIELLAARRSTRACGATRWYAATARSTCSCASYARSSRRPRRTGATSTPTSASAIASRRNRSR